MKTTNLFTSVLFITLAGIAVLFSCNEPDFIGLDVQPESDKFNIFFEEELAITAFTEKEDSIRTDKTVHNLLGNYNDPVFGRVSSGFYSHIRLSSNNVDFGPNPVVDSLVLSLVFKGHYGSMRKVNVEVFEVLDYFYRDSVYYSNTVFNTASQPIGKTSTVPRPNDSIYVDGQMQAPQLRIKLENSLAQRFFNESGSANLADNNAFINFFKGIYVTTSPVNNEGAIMYFDLLNTLSQITLYYSNDNNASLKYNFIINDNCSRINVFDHYNYSGADMVLQQQIAGDTTSGDSVLYLQGMGGTKIKISYPSIAAFANHERIALNKAELIIPVEVNDNSQSIYNLPDKLTLVRVTETGELAFIIDQFEGESHFRGMYDSNKKEYSFIITRHLQNVLSNNIQDYGLYLMVSGAAISGDRAVLRGPKHAQKNMKLRITYIKL